MSEEPFELPPDLLRRIPLFAELSKVLAWSGGPVNWDLARQLAVAVAAAEERAHRVPGDAEARAREDFRLAELWLEEATGLPPPPRLAAVRVLTPAGLAEHAADAYRELIDPLAHRITQAMGEQALPGAEAEAEAGMLGQALRQVAPLFLGIQTGVVLGALAHDVLGQYDVPLPVSAEGTAAVVLPKVEALAESYQLDPGEVRLWVALHESAHRIEFEALPWVRTHFFALYHDYVAALQFDLTGAMERIQQMDLTDPERLQQAIGEQGLFGLVDSPATERALGRIQSLLALLEACADEAVAAAGARLSSGPRIAEAAARQRLDEAKGLRLFSRFIGLEVPAEQQRAADGFARAVLASGGWPALNRVWDEPENLPSADERAAPESWLRRVHGP